MFLLSFKKLKQENLHDDNNISSLHFRCTDVLVSTDHLYKKSDWATINNKLLL